MHKKYFYFTITLHLFLITACFNNNHIESFTDISEQNLSELLIIARNAIVEHFDNPTTKGFQEIVYSDNEIGLFVRLIKQERERGCIGFLKGVGNIKKATVAAALNAAFYDPCFSPLQKHECVSICIEIAVLDNFIQINNPYDFVLGEDSLLLKYRTNSGFLQCSIANQKNYTKQEYLAALCKKARLPFTVFDKEDYRLYKAKTKYLGKNFNLLQQ